VVANCDAPQLAEHLWTNGMPAGPKGHSQLLGNLELQQNQVGSEELPRAPAQPAASERVSASGGYVPAFHNMKT